MKKKKILMLSDHALSTSGVGCQSRFLIEGLIKKGNWTVRQFGAAIKHDSYDLIKVNEDFIILPIDGFGNRDLILKTLITEKPDVLFLFTDPRFFTWLWEIEDEVRQICPIAYWHVWDNHPFPDFNDPYYRSTDLINCHSHMTYELIKDKYPGKVGFIPHALPSSTFFPIPDSDIKEAKSQAIGVERSDDFVLFWVNRNARRKRSGDLLLAWSKFMERAKKDYPDTRVPATLLLHTDPLDQEGPNLYSVAEMLGITESLIFSSSRIEFEKMNILHNISDACINISYAEGFGLATLEAMQCAKPIIATKTGGLTRQVVDHRDSTENGIALDVKFKTLVGSQNVPYIFEDYSTIEDTVDAIYEMFSMTNEERKSLGKKAKSYVDSEFSYQKTVDLWNDSLLNLLENWETEKKRPWTLEEIK